MKKGIVSLVALLGVLLLRPAAIARGDEISDLKQQLEAQSKSLTELQERIAQLEARQKLKEQSLAQKIEAVEQKAEKKEVSALPDNLKWLESIKISGDLRYRYEGIDSQSKGKWGDSVNRNRIRARLNINGKVNDDIDLGFRLASGAQDPVSTNQTLEDSFDKKSVWIDLAYFDWHPKDIKGFDFVGGKMPRPFYRVGDNQLIWDDDLNPEGLAAKYELPLNSTLKAYINGGGFWVGHPDTASAADTSLWGIQGYLKNTFVDKSYLLGGMSYYTYGNIKGQNDLAKIWKGSSNFFGNTSSEGTFAYGYDIVEWFAEYGFKLADFPVAVFGDYAHNTAAHSSKSDGWLIGTTFNKARDPGSWQIGYNYRDIDSDAVVGQFNDSDFIGGGTNGRGHWFNFTYQLAKNFQTGLTYFLDEMKDSYSNNYRRLQADLVFKF